MRMVHTRGCAKRSGVPSTFLQVLVAGTPEQVEASVAAAEPFREELTERGVLVVPLPLFSSAGQNRQPGTLTDGDLK